MKKFKFKINIIIPSAVIFMLTFLCTSVQTGANEVFAKKPLLIPCGMPVGISVYSHGVLITGTDSVTDTNGISKNAAKNAGLKKGDLILSANGTEINSNEELAKIISSSEGTVNITVDRSGSVFDTSVTPVQTESGKKAGIWVRDSTAGIGTLTWYNPQNKTFAALGHGISDSDTCRIFSVRSGDVFRCNITGAVKGTKGMPGELNGIFENKISGSVLKNTPYGVFGTISEAEYFDSREALPAALNSEVKKGQASILCDTDGTGAKEYDIEIIKTDFNNSEGKNFVIKITDSRLIQQTGGIVQGMSGSPIIQNGKLAGAVTHVFVNDPTRGYGIFIENMLNASA